MVIFSIFNQTIPELKHEQKWLSDLPKMNDTFGSLEFCTQNSLLDFIKSGL